MSIFKLFEHAGEDFEHFSDFPRTLLHSPRIFSFFAHRTPIPAHFQLFRAPHPRTTNKKAWAGFSITF
ncbi:hypothetical protein [Alkalicoccobacillus plakortidis]|uniref:Uncharacterized protein n=1 Tax=Alkalicoccobacillus plakortidis TaxID=444060 RepID=A0ABT0XME5_9BACI|nr:hypothetical protein [Alkalicoccobacillus plakortidis]MCM2677078.1 hypothetical protein [Alkalicoccobacillus plakortidis]